MATKNPKSAAFGLLFTLVTLVVVAGGLIWMQRVPGPTAQFQTLPRTIGAASKLDLHVEATRGGLRSLRIELRQGDAVHELASESFDELLPERDVALTVQARDLGLREEEALLLVYVEDGFWRPKAIHGEPVLRLGVRVDLTPPPLSVSGFTRYPEQGGVGLAVLRSEEGASLELESGGRRYPTYASGGNAGVRIGFYAIGADQSLADPILAIATDEAGNSRQLSLNVRPRAKRYTSGEVNISKDWLRGKLPELLPNEDSSDESRYAELFLKLNKEKREEAADFKEQLARRSAQTMLWSDAFLQPRNTRVFSNFADTRDYKIDGVVVDTQVHYGFDLASVEHAPVPAANSGRVLFAGDLGIYGQTVILDHGLGLMTLYAHMSSLDVNEDQDVAQGDVLGLSGSTGLAVGDHVHYEVLMQGQPVNPLQWWDAMWIEDHVRQPMRDAGLRVPSAG